MTTGKDVLTAALSQLGTKESPPESNRVKYNTWYYGKEVSGGAYPWCMAFVQWCYARAGAALPFKTASCGALLRWYREHDPACITKTPVPGDICHHGLHITVVGQVAAAFSCDAELSSKLVIGFEQERLYPALCRLISTHHARGAAADDNKLRRFKSHM